jgi:hypothetical protein
MSLVRATGVGLPAKAFDKLASTPRIMTDSAMIDNQATIPTVDIHELTCRFGDFVAVDRASFTVDRGEIFGLERIPVMFVNRRSQRGSENSCILRD